MEKLQMEFNSRDNDDDESMSLSFLGPSAQAKLTLNSSTAHERYNSRGGSSIYQHPNADEMQYHVKDEIDKLH